MDETDTFTTLNEAADQVLADFAAALQRNGLPEARLRASDLFGPPQKESSRTGNVVSFLDYRLRRRAERRRRRR